MIEQKPSRTGPTRQRASLLSILALLALTSLTANGQERVAFVGVALDTETREADRRLRTYLEQRVSLSFAPEELEYAQVVERLASWGRDEGVYLARTTPYALVASEMLGADLEVLATYISSATGSSTYRAYYVARQESLPRNPTPADVVSLISESKERLLFIHHNLFSTSSFFLPTLHFRSNLVFHASESTESIIALDVEQLSENSSSALVRAVANREADLAAVWDGTRARFTDGGGNPADIALGHEVVFIPLPFSVPNDLLVCSRWAPSEFKEKVRSEIREMADDEIGIGDFRHWVDIVDTPDARTALSRLRWLAREQAAPVTVDVISAGGSRSATPEMLDAARHAVRLSGMEFVLYDQDFHEHIDYRWTIDRIHDGAARLRSTLPGTDIDDQVFPISFHDEQDLTRRIVSLMQGRLHRIRSVWPYSGRQPMVIRDTTLALAPGTELPVQRITWLDPLRNSFRAGPLFKARVRKSSMFVHELEIDDFLRTGEGPITLDPMSNVAFRVYELRQEPPNTFHRIATGVLVVLLTLAAVATVTAARRGRRADFRFDEETLAS